MKNVEELVYGKTDHVEGESQEHWIMEWWKWILNFGVDENPSNDSTGDFTTNNQPADGKVYFLGGGSAGPAANKWHLGKVEITRKVKVPQSKPILVPAAVGIVSVPEFPELFDQDSVIDAYKNDRYKPNVSFIEAKIDDQVIGRQMFTFIETTKPFQVNYVKDNIFDVEQVENTMAVAEGYYLFVKGLEDDSIIEFSQTTEANEALHYNAFSERIRYAIQLTM